MVKSDPEITTNQDDSDSSSSSEGSFAMHISHTPGWTKFHKIKSGKIITFRSGSPLPPDETDDILEITENPSSNAVEIIASDEACSSTTDW